MQLAAAGVSIALLNQASRITIFPLVSITTSFVAEEDTIEKMNIANATENGKAKFSEVVMPHDFMLQDTEKGTPKENNIEAPKESMAGLNNETNGLTTTSVPYDIGNNNKNNNGLDAKTNTCKSSLFTSRNKSKDKVGNKKRRIASASTALLFGTILGLIQAAILIFGAKPLLGVMGLKHVSLIYIFIIKST